MDQSLEPQLPLDLTAVDEVLRGLAACGERLSNAAEERAVRFLCRTLEGWGLEPRLVRLPGFVSTVDEARLERSPAALEGFQVFGNAMTAPFDESGAPRCGWIETSGRPAPATDEEWRRALADPAFTPPALAALRAAGEPAILILKKLPSITDLRAAERLGAAGVLFATGERVRRMIVSDVWGSPASIEDLSRYTALPNASLTEADAKIAAAAERLRLRLRIQSRWTPMPVIICPFGRPDAAAGFLITGHLDSWGPGAVDNASGIAAACAVAKAAAEKARADAAGVAAWRARGVLVFWSGHSHGRYAGSTAFADWLAAGGLEDAAGIRDVFLHLNADCLGMKGGRREWRWPAMHATKRLGLEAMARAGASGEEIRSVRTDAFNRSCDQSLLSIGIPSLFSNFSLVSAEDAAVSLGTSGLAGGYGSRWHTCDDDVEAIDWTALHKEAQVLAEAAALALREGARTIDAQALFSDLKTMLVRAAEALEELEAGSLPGLAQEEAAQSDGCLRQAEGRRGAALCRELPLAVEALAKAVQKALAEEAGPESRAVIRAIQGAASMLYSDGIELSQQCAGGRILNACGGPSPEDAEAAAFGMPAAPALPLDPVRRRLAAVSLERRLARCRRQLERLRLCF